MTNKDLFHAMQNLEAKYTEEADARAAGVSVRRFGGIRLIEKAGGRVAGVGAVIAKAFQPGISKLREAGYRVEALAPVTAMSADHIEFEEDGAHE